MYMNPVQTHVPFIYETSFDLTVVCRDVRAHLDCVTEALRKITKIKL